MYRAVFLAILTTGLAACVSEPKVVDVAPPGISYRVENNNMTDANQRAAQYCAKYGRESRLQTVNRQGEDSIAVYECH